MGFWSSLFESKKAKVAEDSFEEFSDAPRPEITSEQEEDFVDLVFGVPRLSVKNNSQSVAVAGTLNGKSVGFTLELCPHWKAGRIGKIPSYSGTVRITSTGEESDFFIQSLATLYGVESIASRMATTVEFAAISLKGNPSNLSNGPVKLKLFFEPENADGYAEAYANFDLAERKFYFNEKDQEYRSPILRALSAN